MRDADCVPFLQWALPRLGYRWPGFRRVRRQVCKRIGRRLGELAFDSAAGYRALLEAEPAEWGRLDALLGISVSRFFRDRRVFETLQLEVLPCLAASALERGERSLRTWSAGCAGGEEPYSLRILWDLVLQPRFPTLALEILATDASAQAVARARAGCYRASSLKEIPPLLLRQAFRAEGGRLCLSDRLRGGVAFELQDLRAQMPAGPFDLILCRNLAFTYFDEPLQRLVLDGLASRLAPGGVLVIGAHEALPPGATALNPWQPRLGIYRKEEI